MTLKTKLLAIFILLIIPTTALAHGDQKESVSLEVGNDFYSAGTLVDLQKPSDDDAYLAGAVVNVSQEIKSDLTAVGSTLTITSPIGDDLRAAGSIITVASNIGGDAVVAGGVVNILGDSTIAGDAFITGGMLNFAGKTNGDLQIIGDDITFSGQVAGDLEIGIGQKINFGPNAKVTGKLIYSSKKDKEIEIPEGIASSVEKKELGVKDAVQLSFEKKGGMIFGKLFLFAIMFVAGAVLLALSGKFSEDFANTVREKFWWSLLAGSLVLFAPLLALLLFATVIGSYVAVIIITCWILAILASGALMGFLVGSLIFKQDKNTKYSKKLLTLVVGLLILLAISFIPGFGGILKFTIFVVTLGVLVISKLQLYKAAKKAKLV